MGECSKVNIIGLYYENDSLQPNNEPPVKYMHLCGYQFSKTLYLAEKNCDSALDSAPESPRKHSAPESIISTVYIVDILTLISY